MGEVRARRIVVAVDDQGSVKDSLEIDVVLKTRGIGELPTWRDPEDYDKTVKAFSDQNRNLHIHSGFAESVAAFIRTFPEVTHQVASHPPVTAKKPHARINGTNAKAAPISQRGEAREAQAR